MLDSLRRHRLVAIVRGPDTAAALDCVVALVDSGIALIEVSLTTPGALDVIARARRVVGDDFALGAGTVLTREQADNAADAGASYLVTPVVVPDVIAHELPVLAGAFTPTEALAAHTAGACAVKLFPCPGVQHLRALRDPLPDIPFVPVGGVDLDLAPRYLAAGAAAVGIGSPLLGDAPRGGDLTALRDRARTFLKAVGTP